MEAIDEKVDNTLLGRIREQFEGTIPEHWELTTLGDAFKWRSGGTPLRTNEKFYGGDIPWLIIGDLNDGVVNEAATTITNEGLANSATRWVEEGSVLLAMYGSIGKLGIAGKPLTTNQAIAFTKADPHDAMYLFYYLMYARESLASLGKGATQKNISQAVIKEYPFPLAPLPEQRRIVSAIETQLGRLDAAVARLHAAKAKLKRYKQAVLKAAVGDAIENGNMVPLEELITSIGQGWSPKCLNTPSPDEETWGVIKTTAIQPGAYVEEENKELPSPLKPRPEHELKVGDLLVTRAGPRSRVGITCLVRETRPRLMNCDKAYRLRFDAKRVDPAYVEMLLNSPQITDQLDDLKTGISDSGVNLTQGRFLILEMPVIGLKDQRAMILKTQEATASIAEMEATIDAQLLQSTRLRQAVLKRAFEGRLV